MNTISQSFTLINFIENRWADAKDALLEHDKAFFQAIEANEPTGPCNLPEPSYRLGDRWYHVLETTVDVSQQLERLHLTVSKFESSPTRHEAVYYFTTWLQDIYNLCEKLKVLVTHSCQLHSLGNKVKEYFHRKINTEVQDNIGRKRQALVHGADNPNTGLGIDAKAITQDKLWEGNVVAGPSLISDYLVSPGDEKVPAWISRGPPTTTNICAKLGSILHDLDQAISNTKPVDAL